MQGDVFSHTEIQLGTHFNEETGGVVVIRHRARPDECTDQHLVYMQLTPYIHPPSFSHSHFSVIQLHSLPFPAFGPCPEHVTSFAHACIVSLTQSHKLLQISDCNFALFRETHDSLVSLVLSVTKFWLNFSKVMCEWCLPCPINQQIHLAGLYYCLSCLLIKVYVSACLI